MKRTSLLGQHHKICSTPEVARFGASASASPRRRRTRTDEGAASDSGASPGRRAGGALTAFGCGENGVSTNGAAAKVMSFAGLEKRYVLAFWGKQIKWEYQQESLSKNTTVAVTPLVLTPFVPFRKWGACRVAGSTGYGTTVLLNRGGNTQRRERERERCEIVRDSARYERCERHEIHER